MTLKLGSVGTGVTQLQTALDKLGYLLTVDGMFGLLTEVAVKDFQKNNALTVDGIVGPITSAKLEAIVNGTPTPTQTQLIGIDLYHGDVVTNWQQVKEALVSFIFLKAGEGNSFIDPSFKTNWTQAKAQGLTVGAYHFFHPSEDSVSQADLFTKVMGSLTDADLPPVMDWETTDGVNPTNDKLTALNFLRLIEEATHRRPIIYLSPSFADELSLDASFAKYPLWVAHYGVTTPRIPNPWSAYTFWQTGDSGAINGISNAVDMNVFSGNADALSKFIASSKV